jgi:hypothetical protein
VALPGLDGRTCEAKRAVVRDQRACEGGAHSVVAPTGRRGTGQGPRARSRNGANA